MNIRKLSPSDEKIAKEVWKICFDDSDQFIDTYFEKIANFENSFGYYENEELIADLFMLNFDVKLGKETYATDFLAGCATLPKARKRGLMRELVKKAMFDMRERGLACTYLHPFLHAFYRKFGYETVAYVTRHSLTPKDIGRRDATIYTSMEELPLKKMENAYANYMKAFDHCFLRNHKRFEDWLHLLFADHGKVALCDENDMISYALYFEENNVADVFELVLAEKGADVSLLNQLPVGRVDYLLPAMANTMDNEEFTMMRVLDPQRMLEHTELTTEEVVVQIVDDFLEEEHRFVVRAGKNKNEVTSTDATADIVTEPAEFAALIAGASVSNERAPFKMFTSCFFETY